MMNVDVFLHAYENAWEIKFLGKCFPFVWEINQFISKIWLLRRCYEGVTKVGKWMIFLSNKLAINLSLYFYNAFPVSLILGQNFETNLLYSKLAIKLIVLKAC